VSCATLVIARLVARGGQAGSITKADIFPVVGIVIERGSAVLGNGWLLLKSVDLRFSKNTEE
jgi:hypothetical protein